MCGDDDRRNTNAEAQVVGHNIKCERARTPKKQCKCSCGGVYHGISVRLDDFFDDIHRMSIDSSFGGKLWRRVKKLSAVQMTCRCGCKFTLDNPKGYLHEGGITDKNGKQWWLYYTCPECDKDWAWWKIVNMVKDGYIAPPKKKDENNEIIQDGDQE